MQTHLFYRTSIGPDPSALSRFRERRRRVCGVSGHAMSTKHKHQNTAAQRTNDSFDLDVSTVTGSVQRAVEILETNDEQVTIGRVVGTAYNVGAGGSHRLETYVRVAREYLDEGGYDSTPDVDIAESGVYR